MARKTSFMVRKSRVRLRYGSKRPGGNGRNAVGSQRRGVTLFLVGSCDRRS